MENNKVYFEDLTPEQQKEQLDNIPTPEKEKEHYDLYCQRFRDYYEKSFRELNDRTITLERLKRKRHNFNDLLAKIRMVYRDIYIQKSKPLIYNNLPELNDQTKQRWEYQMATLEDLITSVDNQIEGYSFRETQAKEIKENKMSQQKEAEDIMQNGKYLQMLIPLTLERIVDIISKEYEPFKIYGEVKQILQENPEREPINISYEERSFVRFKPEKYDFKTKDKYYEIDKYHNSLCKLREMQLQLSNASYISPEYEKLKSEIIALYIKIFCNKENPPENFNISETFDGNIIKPKLTLTRLALLHIYNKINVLDPRTDPERGANEIAARFGFRSLTSGQQFYDKFRKLDGVSSQRTGVVNKKQMVQDIEAVLYYLKEEAAIKKAKEELLKLKEPEQNE